MEETVSPASALGWLKVQLHVDEMRGRRAADYAEITGRPVPDLPSFSLPRFIQQRARSLQEELRRAEELVRHLRAKARKDPSLRPELRLLQKENQARQAEVRRLQRLVAGPRSKAHRLQAQVEKLAREREQIRQSSLRLTGKQRKLEEEFRRQLGLPIPIPARPPPPRAAGDPDALLLEGPSDPGITPRAVPAGPVVPAGRLMPALDRHEAALRVVEDYHQDGGRAIARVDMETMKRMGLVSGDVIEIRGKRAVPAVVWPDHFPDSSGASLRVDGNLRDDAGVAVGEQVKIRKAEARDARRIVVAPAQAMEFLGGFVGGDRYLRRTLEGRPMVKGQRLRVEMLGNPLAFVVTGTAPPGVVLCKGDTRVVLRERPPRKGPGPAKR